MSGWKPSEKLILNLSNQSINDDKRLPFTNAESASHNVCELIENCEAQIYFFIHNKISQSIFAFFAMTMRRFIWRWRHRNEWQAFLLDELLSQKLLVRADLIKIFRLTLNLFVTSVMAMLFLEIMSFSDLKFSRQGRMMTKKVRFWWSNQRCFQDDWMWEDW